MAPTRKQGSLGLLGTLDVVLSLTEDSPPPLTLGVILLIDAAPNGLTFGVLGLVAAVERIIIAGAVHGGGPGD